MVISQGDIFWLSLGKPRGSEPGYRHPFVVIQNNIFNRSRIPTVVVCALTSTLQRASSPGNVMLRKGEANLEKRSVINVSQIYTVNRTDLRERIGTLSKARIEEVLAGVNLLTRPAEVE